MSKDMTEKELHEALARHGITWTGSGGDASYGFDGWGSMPVRSIFGDQLPWRNRRVLLAELIRRKDTHDREVAGRATDFSRGARIVVEPVFGSKARTHAVVLACIPLPEGGRRVTLTAGGKRMHRDATRELRAYDKREHGTWRGPQSVLDALQDERARAMQVVDQIDAEIASEQASQ